jgi:hypothetical protein
MNIHLNHETDWHCIGWRSWRLLDSFLTAIECWSRTGGLAYLPLALYMVLMAGKNQRRAAVFGRWLLRCVADVDDNFFHLCWVI